MAPIAFGESNPSDVQIFAQKPMHGMLLINKSPQVGTAWRLMAVSTYL